MMQNKVILLLSLPLFCLIVLAGITGLSIPDFYSAETENWQAQSIGQDMINLFFIAPCLLVTAVLSYYNYRNATLMWGGTILYLTYTFTLYCFDVHFNRMFVVYCLCLGLSFYSLIYFLHTQFIQTNKLECIKHLLHRITGVYFIVLSALFYFLWLAEIIPAINQNITPKSVLEAGLFTNGVHVLDLSIVLPGIFLTGLFLLKNNVIGFMLAPVFLTFFVLMDVTIGTLVLIMKWKGIESDYSIAIVMGALALFSSILLYLNLKSLKLLLSAPKENLT